MNVLNLCTNQIVLATSVEAEKKGVQYSTGQLVRLLDSDFHEGSVSLF